jgi:hypothetical protein
MIQLMCKCTIGRFQYHNSVIEFSEQQHLAHKETQSELPRKRCEFDLFFGCGTTQNVSVVCIYLYIYSMVSPFANHHMHQSKWQRWECSVHSVWLCILLCVCVCVCVCVFDCLNSRPTVLVGCFGSTFEPFFNHVCIYRHIYRHSWGLGLEYLCY